MKVLIGSLKTYYLGHLGIDSQLKSNKTARVGKSLIKTTIITGNKTIAFARPVAVMAAA